MIENFEEKLEKTKLKFGDNSNAKTTEMKMTTIQGKILTLQKRNGRRKDQKPGEENEMRREKRKERGY